MSPVREHSKEEQKMNASKVTERTIEYWIDQHSDLEVELEIAKERQSVNPTPDNAGRILSLELAVYALGEEIKDRQEEMQEAELERQHALGLI